LPDGFLTEAGAWDVADLALENPLSPEIIEEARLEPTWEVDVIPFPGSFGDDPGSRPGVLVVSAGSLVVYWEALRRPPAEAEELAREFGRGVQAAAEVLGRHPEGVVVRYPEVGAELELLLAGEGTVLSVMPFLPGLDEVAASMQCGSGGAPVRPVLALPDSWAGWDLPEPILADLMVALEFLRDTAPPVHRIQDEDPLQMHLFDDEPTLVSQRPGPRSSATARTFLDALVQEDGTKATSAGKLNRAFVRTMLREGQWPERLIRYMEKR
jgi:hypothetical protein